MEIKCGRDARLIGKQKETYNALIAKGVPLRMIRVRIVSFDRNRFLVEEHSLSDFDVDELVSIRFWSDFTLEADCEGVGCIY